MMKRGSSTGNSAHAPNASQVEDFGVPRFDRTLADYINPTIAAGLRLEEICEPRAPESACALISRAFKNFAITSRCSFTFAHRSRETKMIRALIGILACMMLAGCGAQGEAYQPSMTPASQAVIYIYRPYGLLSSQTNPMITCGHESIELDGGGFDEFVADSGSVTCSAADRCFRGIKV